VGTEAQPPGLGIGDVAGLGDEVAQAEQLGPVEPEERPGVEEHDLVAVGDGGEERLEGHLLAVDLDGDAQVEPVAGLGVLAPLARAEPHDRCRGDLLVGGQVAVDLDGDVLVGLERGQGGTDEPGCLQAREHDPGDQVGLAAEVGAQGPGYLAQRVGAADGCRLGVTVAPADGAEPRRREGPRRAVVRVPEVEAHLPGHVAHDADVHGHLLRLGGRLRLRRRQWHLGADPDPLA
jgi:hypothetical protein